MTGLPFAPMFTEWLWTNPPELLSTWAVKVSPVLVPACSAFTVMFKIPSLGRIRR